MAFFLSRSQILLLQTFIELSFNRADALTELTFADVNNILSTSRFVFLSLGAIKSNLSEKVLWLQAGLGQNIFRIFNKTIILYWDVLDLTLIHRMYF